PIAPAVKLLLDQRRREIRVLSARRSAVQRNPRGPRWRKRRACGPADCSLSPPLPPQVCREPGQHQDPEAQRQQGELRREPGVGVLRPVGCVPWFESQRPARIVSWERIHTRRVCPYYLGTSWGSRRMGIPVEQLTFDLSIFTGKDVADRWYNEVKNYNYNRPGFSSGTGHFTAMVWRSTKKLGVGKAEATDGSTFVVARYFPAGNITNQGHFEANVLPPRN
uniref:GLI pathogenesis-related 2, like n=1 Tax=Scleropages formosus TaxID=113540 RepID=A0A8C9WLK9_SCLFO